MPDLTASIPHQLTRAEATRTPSLQGALIPCAKTEAEWLTYTNPAYFPWSAGAGMNFISASQASDCSCQASHMAPL
jgi:hypothetical protein